MEDKKIKLNEGGVNGTGKGVVNTNSNDFIFLKEAVKKHAENQSTEDKAKYALLSLKLQMKTYILDKEPPTIITVGNFLKKHLKAIDIKHKQFAEYIELEESNFSSIIRGRRKLTIDLAFKLGQIFNVEPDIWLSIQSKNELLEASRENKLTYKKYKLKDLLKKAG